SLDRAQGGDLPPAFLDTEPVESAAFGPLPPEGAHARNYDRWAKELVRWIQSEYPLTLFESRAHKVFSKPGETERDFRMRLADLGREARDREADKLKQKYEAKFRTLEDRLRRAEQAAEKRAARS